MGFILNKRGANFTTTNRTGTEVSTVVLMLPALQARQLTWEGQPLLDRVGSNGWRGWCFLSQKLVVFFFSGDPKGVT